MKTIELLSPVGNSDTLNSAIKGGADAVYLGGSFFGARKYSKNFNNEEMIEAIRLCKIYGIKIYVTLNTLIYDDEVEDFLNYVEFLLKNNVDALIMQDFGMINLVLNRFSNAVIHASTQMNNVDENGIKALKEIGVQRAVLARELSIEEIKKISNIMEIEVFVHGALCFAYSGICYISSLSYKRSGNRGECSQCCRLKYKSNDIEKYFMSTKDLSTIKNIEDILNSGVVSLKIEGRLKSREYVYLSTLIYRTLIDNYKNKTNKSVETLLNDLKKTFNRGFTNGLIFGSKDTINSLRPNHMGVKIGDVVKCDENKIYIKLTDDVSQNDGIKFEAEDKGLYINRLYLDKKLVSSATKGQIVSIDNTINLKKTSSVLKTQDNYLIKEISEIEEKKVPLKIFVKAKLNEKLYISISDNVDTVEVYKGIVLESINRPITKDNIIKQISKLNDTVYTIFKIDIDIDDSIFIPLKELNELRREAIELLIDKKNKSNDIIKSDYKYEDINIKVTNTINVKVTTEKALLEVLKYEGINIYIDDYALYCKYKNTNTYYIQSRIGNDYRIEDNVVVSTLGGLIKYNNFIGNYQLNIVNSYSLYYYHLMGCTKASLSCEINIADIKNIIKTFYNRYNFKPNVEVLIYGKYEAMVTKHGVDSTQLNDRVNREFLVREMDDYKIIYDSNIIDNINIINEYRKIGVTNFRIDFLDEEVNQIKSILSRLNIEKKHNI